MSGKIYGAHFLLYSRDPDADRAFFRDVLRFGSVDVGGGWLIFKLPPAEIAVHPAEGEATRRRADDEEENLAGAVLYLMCDDVKATVKALAKRKVDCSPLVEAPWGIKTTFALPSGAEIGLYQPKHETALELD